MSLKKLTPHMVGRVYDPTFMDVGDGIEIPNVGS